MNHERNSKVMLAKTECGNIKTKVNSYSNYVKEHY